MVERKRMKYTTKCEENGYKFISFALCASLEKIVTASVPRFGDWKWRLATLPINMNGLGIFSAGDIINYAFVASRLQISSLQVGILANSDLTSLARLLNRLLVSSMFFVAATLFLSMMNLLSFI